MFVNKGGAAGTSWTFSDRFSVRSGVTCDIVSFWKVHCAYEPHCSLQGGNGLKRTAILVTLVLALALSAQACLDSDRERDPPETPVFDSVNRVVSKGWNPAAGSRHLHPIIRCSSVSAPGAIGSPDTGTGALIRNPGVELVNPEVVGCSYGVENRAAGTRITFDPAEPEYAASGFRNNRYGILLEQGSRDVEIRAANGGEGSLVDNFRPVTVRSISGTSLIEDLDVSHPGVYPWQQAGDKNIVGIKLLCDFNAMPAADRRCSGLTVSSNDLHGADEEVLSAEGNGNNTTRGSENTIQNTAKVTARNRATDVVTLDENLSGLPLSLVGAYMSLNTGDPGVVGEYLKITAQGSNTLKVDDPNDHLAGVAVGDEVSMGGVYENIVFRNNFIDMQGRAMIGGDFLGPVTHSVLENNTFVGLPYRRYANSTHYRDCLDGAGYRACLQSFAVITNGETAGPGPGDEVSVASNNTVRGNTFTADLSTAVRHRTDLSDVPVHVSGNTFSAGYRRHNDGSYRDLPADPNP
jgi:hypothetical protein